MSVSYTIDISDALRLAEIFPQMLNVIADEIRKSMLESGLLLTTMVAVTSKLAPRGSKITSPLPATAAVRAVRMSA